MASLSLAGSAVGATRVKLVKDINPGPDFSRPVDLTDVGGTLFFGANDGHGAGLWKSDGTADGTRLITRLRGISNPTRSTRADHGASPLCAHIAHVGNTLFFSAANRTYGTELWRSDGTTSGTRLVKDINPSGGSFPLHPATVGGMVFFEANDGVHGYELWRSDGTASGTKLVKDINPAGTSNPYNFAKFRGKLFFSANDGTHGREVWKSDGTAKGTKLLKDINPAPDPIGNANYFTRVGDTLFFTANDGVHGYELWKSDGTRHGTKLVKDIYPGGPDSNSYPGGLTNFQGSLLFTASGGTASSSGLWESDGTAKGTKLVKNIGAEFFTNLSGTLFFGGDDGVRGNELWRSDGTPKGTRLVKDIYPGGGPCDDGGFCPLESVPHDLTSFDHRLFFAATDTNGQELWKSDGTPGGTKLVKDIYPGEDSRPDCLTPVGGTLFFVATDAAHGSELWKASD